MQDVNKIELRRLQVIPGAKMLDLGCSSGLQALAMAAEGLVVTGVDNSLPLLGRCLQSARLQAVSCSVVAADAGHLPFSDDTFDGAVCTEVLEHVPSSAAALAELGRTLRLGGRTCIAVPTARTERLFRVIHRHWAEDSGHVAVIKQSNIEREMQAANLAVENVVLTNFEWSLFWILHSIFQSRFDFTGSPLGHQRLSHLYWRAWEALETVHLAGLLKRCGNRVLPKSVYLYAVKV